MCFMCDDSELFERPTEETISVIPLIKLAYDAGEDFGALHIVLEDGNIETDHIKWCMEENKSFITLEGLMCAIALLNLSEEQRMTAIMLAQERDIVYK